MEIKKLMEIRKMEKKGATFTWSVIIGAVIALVVLIVLLVIFTEKTATAERGLSQCEGKGGICVIEEEPCPVRTLETAAFDCPTGRACCLGTPKECNELDKPCARGEECSVEVYKGKRYCFST